MIKKFNEFVNETFIADLSLTDEERIYISNVIENGDLCISTDDKNTDLAGLEIKVFDHTGYDVPSKDVNQRVKDQISKSILNGKNFGIINDEPNNKEWQIEI